MNNKLRSVGERLSRGIVLKRKLPVEFEGRTMYVSPEAGGLRYWQLNTSKVDPQLLSIVSNYIKPGFVVWDIGANIGLFTLTAAVKAGRTGKVLSVEADVFNSYILSKSLKANPDLNIDLLTCAIANQKGLVQFNIANRARCSNFINLSKGNTDSGGVRNYYNVLCLTLDEIIKWYDAPDFIKVDIEGAEKYLLAGAEELFQLYTPIVYMEVEKINAAYIKEFFKSKGYKMFDGENPSIEIFEPVSNTVFIHFKSQQ